MKKYMMMAALAAATMSLTTSCSDDELVKMSTNDGDIINFTAVAKQSHATRTVYGPQNSNKSWPLYWIDKDEVKVFCPEANVQDGNVNVATYAVAGDKLSADTPNKYSLGEAEDGKALHWGALETHHFYEAYPAKNVSTITETTVTATIPATQHVTDQGNGYYADMDAALMVGKTQVTKTAFEESGVDLPFEPIFTAVDIVIDPNERLTNDFHITSITVANAESETSIKPLAGEFTYTYDASDELKFASVSSATEAYNVQLEFVDDIVFSKDRTTPLKVTAFLRGDYSNTVKVVINGYSLSDGKKQYGTMKRQGTPTEPNHCLTKLARNSVNLGLIPNAFMELTGEWWLSHEADDKYVSQMSIPGSYDSGNFAEGTDGNERTQTKSLGTLVNDYRQGGESDENAKYRIPGNEVVKYQLNHGIRAFDFKLQWSDANKFYMQRSSSKDIPVYFEEFLTYAVTWLQSHTTEFLIVFTRPLNNDNKTSYENNITSEIKRILKGKEAYYLSRFSPDVKVSQARGKILFVEVGYDKNDYIGNTLTQWNTTTQGQQTSTFGTGESVAIHDWDYLNTTLSVNDDANKKKTSLKNAFDNAVARTSPSSWNISCSACTKRLLANYAGLAGNRGINKYVADYADNCTSGQHMGIVFAAYVCTGRNSGGGQDGQYMVDHLWALNFR